MAEIVVILITGIMGVWRGTRGGKLGRELFIEMSGGNDTIYIFKLLWQLSPTWHRHF